MAFKKISYFTSLLLLVDCVRSSVIPVEKCHLEDSSCMTSAFQKAAPVYFNGLPEMGIEVHDPLAMSDVEFDLSGLQFTLKGGKLTGMKNAIIDDVKWDLKQKNFKVSFHLDCIVTGHYTAAGKVLVLPITGDGNMELKAKNMEIKLVVPYEIKKGNDNKDHVAPKKLDFEFIVKDNTHFDFTGLFGGNKELSDAMHKFLNENWQEVSTEFGRPLVEAAVKKIFKNLVTFFKKNAIEDIAQI